MRLPVVILQSLIQLAGSPAVGNAITSDFVEAALLEIVSDFAAVDAVLRGVDAEDLAKKLESSLPVPLKVGEDLANVEVPLGTEPSGVEDQVAGNWHAHDRAADVDVWEIEGF